MKKYVSVILSVLVAGLLVACGSEKDSGVANDALEITEQKEDDMLTETGEKIEKETNEEVSNGDSFENAADAVDNMLIGWNLGNSFDATGDWIMQSTTGSNDDFETAWGNPVTPDTLMPKVKSLGFEAVRMPITWRYHFDEEGNIDEAWMARVQEVVDETLDAGLYCIINVHHDTGADGWLRASESNFESNSALYAKLWEQIAERFKDYPEKLLFEGFNEMLDENSEWNNPKAESVAVINSYNQIFVDTVRATGGNNTNRNLVCCTYAAATTDSVLNGFNLPNDSANNHLIAEVHYYSPYEFITDEGITWTTPISEYSDYVEKTIDDAFVRIENKLMTKGVPVIVGEFATDDKDNTEDRIKWYTHVIEQANERNITCFIWDNGNGYCMGHIDREGNEDAFPEIIEACVKAAE